METAEIEIALFDLVLDALEKNKDYEESKLGNSCCPIAQKLSSQLPQRWSDSNYAAVVERM